MSMTLNAAELAEIGQYVAMLNKMSGETTFISLGECQVWSDGTLIGMLTNESGEYEFRAEA